MILLRQLTAQALQIDDIFLNECPAGEGLGAHVGCALCRSGKFVAGNEEVMRYL
jgi:hypothetical protein